MRAWASIPRYAALKKPLENNMPYDWQNAITLIEAVGWVASILTIATYAMNTMMLLRILALASSACFVIYGTVLQLWPLVVMELVLLPINGFRLWQLVSLRHLLDGSEKRIHDDYSVIRRYGKKRKILEGVTIFERGESVEELYFLAKGRILIEEYELELEAGNIFGEIGFFTDAAARTATARCLEDAVVYTLNQNQFMRLQFEDPSFGLSVMRTVTRRLQQNANDPLSTISGNSKP